MRRLGIITLLFIVAVVLSFLVLKVEKNSGSIKSVFDAFWWMIATISTVGYGDIVPKTIAGRVLGIAIIIIGTSIFSLITGSVASYLVDLRIRSREGAGKVALKRHIAILGNSGKIDEILAGAVNLLNVNIPPIVLVGTFSTELVEMLKNKYPNLNLHFVKGDYTNENVLKQANIQRAHKILILLDESVSREEQERKNLHAVLTARSLSKDAEIYVETKSAENARHLIRAGATDVILPEEMSSFLLSGNLSCPAINQLFRTLTNPSAPKLKAVPIPQSFKGKQFSELMSHFRKDGMTPIAVVSVKESLKTEDLLTNDEAIDSIIMSVLSEIDLDSEKERRYDVIVNPEDDYMVKSKDIYAIVVTK